jgi:hypothetical protein
MLELIRDRDIGKWSLRLFRRRLDYLGVLKFEEKVCKTISGPSSDGVWQQMESALAQLDPDLYGFAGARTRFLRTLPNGFTDAGFLADERDYKVRARDLLNRVAPLEGAATQRGLGKAVLSVFQATNLLHHVEKAKLSELLRAQAADEFVSGAASFAQGDVEDGLAVRTNVLKPYRSATWTVTTYLPYLWRPESHMFLKPEVTKKFAERVGHPFARQYRAALGAEVYLCLLDLVQQTKASLADLAPRDNIDIQSFIWVVGESPPDRGPATRTLA